MIITILASKGWPIHHLNIKTALLHGELKEEVYITQPEGFMINGKEDKVYKLHQSSLRLETCTEVLEC